MAQALVPEESSADALLLLSELATNSMRHSGGAFHVRAFFGPDQLRVEVRGVDEQHLTIELPDYAPDAESGRSLFLVASLAHRWGRFRSRRGSGMFFELTQTAPAPTSPSAPSTETDC